MKLKTLIAKLEKLQERYIKDQGKDPVIWAVGYSDDSTLMVEVCGGKSRTKNFNSCTSTGKIMAVDTGLKEY